MRHRTLSSAALAVSLTFLAAACGSDGSSDAADTTVEASGEASATMNDADIEFAQGMIAHHEQAIEMAEIALDPTVGASAEVVDLATRIRDAQDPEVQLMTGWLEAAGEPVAMDMSDGHDMSDMDGMMSADDMDALSTMTGADFDDMWLTMMNEHHEGAISQSEDVKEAGSDPAVAELADQIISAQKGEIDEMKALLAD